MTPPPLARWVIAVAGPVYVAGVVLLAVGVYADLPGPLAAYGEPRASWPVAVQVVAGVAAYGTWRWVNRRSARPFAVVLLGLGVATVLVLASASYARCPDPGLSRGWSVVTRVVGLVTNNYAIDMFAQPTCEIGGVPLALQFARLAQLLVVLVAFTSALTALLRTQVDRFVVRWSPWVTLAVGADEDSGSLLTRLAAVAARRETLAVVTTDALAPWVANARTSGWRVVVGDPMDERLLRRLLLGPRRRSTLDHLVVLHADSLAATQQLALVQDVVDQPSGVSALLRIDDAWQGEEWRREWTLERVGGWVIDTVSRPEETVRRLVDHVLASGAEVIVVTGHSDLTYAVLPELAQQERERRVGAQLGTPEVVLVGPHADEVLIEFEAGSRRYGMSSELRVRVENEPLEALLDTERVVALLMTDDPSSGDQRTAVRLVFDRDDLRVYVQHTGVHGVSAEPLVTRVWAYGATLDVGPGGTVGRWERLAATIHASYIRHYPDPDRPARRPWAALEPFYRESNLRQVLNVLGAAVAVGRSWGATTSSAPSAPSEEQLEEMSRLEHESWRAHLQRAGRPHPDRVPWEELQPESRAKTRTVVADALDLLDQLGYRSFDDPYAAWVTFRRTGEVSAVRRTEAWTWRTADGAPMRGAAGDWEVSDERGTTRSVAGGIFERTHEHVAGDRWRRTGEVRGRQARPGELVRSLEGEQTARAGQWVLRGVADEEWLVSTEHLERTYERVS